jgi:transcriptional regulator with XRE-family HTH domain
MCAYVRYLKALGKRKSPADTQIAFRHDARGMTNTRLNEKLKSLRERAGLSIRDVGAALGSSGSSYSHYEYRYKEDHLPFRIAQQLARLYAEHGIAAEDVMALAGNSVGLNEPPSPFAAPKPQTTAARALRNLDRPPATDIENEIKIAIVGKTAQIVATVDRDAIEDLITD